MDDIIKSQQRKFPFVNFDLKGLFELKGSSIMEDAIAFYDPYIKEVKEYVKEPKNTVVNVELEYFNTSSAKILLIFFKALPPIQNSGFEIVVNWYYEEDDEEIFESGQNFSTMSGIKFNFIRTAQKDVKVTRLFK